MKKMAPFMVILAASLWGAVGLFTRYLYAFGFEAAQVAAIRCFVAAISIVIFLLIKDKGKLKISLKHIKYFFFTGVIGIALCYVAYFTTMKLGSLSVATILLYTAPFFVMVASSFLFKERFTLVKAIALTLSIIGCCLITGIIGGSDVQTITIQGVLVGVASGLGYAIYNIASRYALAHYDSYTTTAYTFIFASVAMIPFASLPKMAGLMSLHPVSILLSLAIGIGCTIIPYTIYVTALNHMEVGKASILAFVEPLVSTLIGILVFQEAFTLSSGVAIALIFISVILLNLNWRPKAEESERMVPEDILEE